ncbi:MAG: hypothetical protein MI861_25530, partial [Pirellulales bacterium]|nr:hypothetical protein [Pirellulales bacterium]
MSSAGFHPLDVPRLRRAAKKLAHADPALADVLQTHGPPPLWKRPATFATFVRIILEQQVSLDSAKSVFDRLAKRCGRPVTAAGILVLGQGRLRELGVTRQKTRYIIALASDVRDRRFRIGSLRHLGNQQQRNL